MRFNLRVASFCLVALVIIDMLAISSAAAGACIYHADKIAAGTFKCLARTDIKEILLAALTTALAFSRDGGASK